MARKNSKRQEKKMKKLQAKREKMVLQENQRIIDRNDKELRKRTSRAIYDINQMTPEYNIELLNKIACSTIESEFSSVPVISRERKDETKGKKLGGKRVRKDRTYNGTVTRVYYTARENVSISKGKYVAFVLLFMAFFTLYFTSSTLSRYAGTTAGNGSVRVAKWNVGIEETLDPKTLNIVSGTFANYVLEVKSASETASNYSINLSNIPVGVEVQLDGAAAVTPTNGEVSFANAGSFNANSSGLTRNHTLTFVTTLDTAAVNNNEVDIDVVFVQEEL